MKQWSLQHTVELDEHAADLASLSWGPSHELLIGGLYLTIFSVNNSIEEPWKSRKLANGAKFARFSHDASLIASTGWRDRLVKIWRRLFTGEHNQKFDTAYLKHPATVTDIRWRGRPAEEEAHLEPVLYTCCADNHLRVWTALDPHCLQILQLWTEINLTDSLQLHMPLSPTGIEVRYVTVLDRFDFAKSVDMAVSNNPSGESESLAQENLRTIAAEDPEICIIFDKAGNMSAWSLEHVGAKSQQNNTVLNIAHTEGLDFKFGRTPDNATFSSFLGSTGTVEILINSFDGRLQWLSGGTDKCLEPTPAADCLRLRAELTGHSDNISLVASNLEGNIFLSHSSNLETIIWSLEGAAGSGRLVRSGFVPLKQAASRAWLIRRGEYAIILHDGFCSLWDVHLQEATKICQYGFLLDESRISCIEAIETAKDTVLLAAVYSDLSGPQVEFKPLCGRMNVLGMTWTTPLTQVSIIKDQQAISTLPAHKVSRIPSQSPMTSGQKESLSILACSEDGSLASWTAQWNQSSAKVTWKFCRTIESWCFEPALVVASPRKCVAIVNKGRTEVSVWNLSNGELEFDKRMPSHESVQDVHWLQLSSADYALIIVLRHQVAIYISTAFQPENEEGPSSWILARRKSISELTNIPIAHVAWTAAKDAVIAAGHQIFVLETSQDFSRQVLWLRNQHQANGNIRDLPGLARCMNCAVPDYHPTMICHTLLAGYFDRVLELFSALESRLKFLSEVDDLANAMQGLQLLDLDHESYHEPSNDDKDMEMFNADASISLSDSLKKLSLPDISDQAQDHAKQLVNCASVIQRQNKSVDPSGLRYLTLFEYDHRDVARDQRGNSTRQNHRLWERVAWAFCSDSQDILVDLTSRQDGGRMLWKDARETGIFLWMKDLDALVSFI